MKALITGASSGIGRSIATYLSSKNIDLILVARNKKELDKLASNLDNQVKVIAMDLSNSNNVLELYEKVKNDDIDILVNNAGFGLFGLFNETSLDKELEMIDLNIKTYHILTKLFLKDFVKRNSGYILNVCSSAGFLAGPRLSTYYATKNYVTKLSMAIYEELRQMKSNVHISMLCPGPVETNFNNVANGSFTIKGLSSDYVAKYAIDKMFKNKLIIVPGLMMKLSLFLSRFVPHKILLAITYKIQYKKEKGRK